MLLDTNVVSELWRPGPDAAVLRWFAEQPDDGLFLSVVTVAELRKGIARLPRSRRRAALEVAWDTLVESYSDRILAVDIETARCWGEMLAAAERDGRRMNTTDALIAATAICSGLTVATRNERDFTASGVDLVNPWTFG